MPDEVTGGCLCGAVRYTVTGEIVAAGCCHCSLCRRFGGGAAASIAPVRGDQFQITQGADGVRVFRWEDRKDYVFCATCGSSLCTIARWPPAPDSRVNIRMGTFDGDPGVRPAFHIYVGSKAVWDDITDDLPQFAEGLG